jgi:hypothetical protein
MHQKFACGADERMTPDVFLISRLLADHHYFDPVIALHASEVFPKNGLGGSPV